MNENRVPENRRTETLEEQGFSSDRYERRAERRAERKARRDRGGGIWVGGAVLIVLGLVVMARNLGYAIIGNWWALLILLPGVAALANAYTGYRDAGYKLTRRARGSLMGGLILVFIAASLLFDLRWGNLWPMLLIMGGIAILLNTLLPSAEDETPA
jgi:uncharacterized membrane protein